MKKLALLLMLSGGLGLSTGCETPADTTQQRFQMIGRNWGFEYEQINDDIDHLFLLRPATHLTIWHIQ